MSNTKKPTHYWDGIKLVPEASATPSSQGEMKYDSSTDKLKVKGASTVGSVVEEAKTATLTNKTIDGDDNTVQDLALTSLKTNLSDASKFIVRDAAGIPVSNTKTVPTGTVVGTSDTQALTNKIVVVASNTITTAASGNLAATELNTALAELQSDVDTRALNSDLLAHEADTSTHGVGEIVGRTESQTLTNKTLTSPTINTPTGIVKSDVGLGNVDNTSDSTKNAASVALTNKTISRASNTLSGYTAHAVVTADSSGNAAAGVAPGTTGNVLTSDGTDWVSSTPTTAPDQSYEISNLSLACSVATNALTIALKDKSGSNPSAGSPVKIGFRNATSATGTYNQRSATAALSVVVPSGATLGHADATNCWIYVYALDNSGTIELAVSSIYRDEGSIGTTTAIDTASDDSGFYSTSARSNVSFRLIARLKSNQTTAGTWAAVPTEITLAGLNTNIPVTEYLEAKTTSKTPTASGNFHQMTGNSITLTPGIWMLNGRVFWDTSGGSATYTDTFFTYTTANGADSGSEPANISASSNITIQSPTGNTNRLGRMAVNSAAVMAEHTSVDFPFRLNVNKATTIYLVPSSSQTTAANARVTAYLYAERIS